MYKIFIVEDDSTITAVLTRTLEKWNYQVSAVEDFGGVLEQFERIGPDLVLMDISLPLYDGFYWCAQIRRQSQVPIIFISSADQEMNLVMAVNMGADDFLAKPFKLEVVLAKIQALLRRTYTFTGKRDVIRAGEAVLSLGDGTLEAGAAEGDVTEAGAAKAGAAEAGSAGPRKLELTKNELRILKLLMERKGNVVPRDDIIRQLWESEDFIDDNTLTVNMTRLRKKLEGIGLNGFIETRKGLGYLISDGTGREGRRQ